jgi:hypothetical protein
MAKYKVSIQWMLTAEVEVEAETLEKAFDKVDQDYVENGVPPTGEYLEDSMEINFQFSQFLNHDKGE